MVEAESEVGRGGGKYSLCGGEVAGMAKLAVRAVAGRGGEPSGEWAEVRVRDPLPGVCDREVGMAWDLGGRGREFR